MTTLTVLGILGGQEIIIILIIVLLLFGGKKIPELMRGLGRGVSEFNKAKNDVSNMINEKDVPQEKKDVSSDAKEKSPVA